MVGNAVGPVALLVGRIVAAVVVGGRSLVQGGIAAGYSLMVGLVLVAATLAVLCGSERSC